MKNIKFRKALIVLLILIIILSTLSNVYAVTVNVPGVSQGTDDIHYAAGAPLATIIIDQSIIANPAKAQEQLLSEYPGFTFATATEVNDKSYLSGSSFSMDSKILVYDESIAGATRITGVTNSMNTFTGDIVSFTYDNAALLPDGTRGKVVITYSDISFPMQNNFGRNGSIGSDYNNFYTNADTTMAGTIKGEDDFSDFWEYDETNNRGKYIGDGLYTVGFGRRMHVWNTLVKDCKTNSDSGYTTRNGLKLNIKIQIIDNSGNAVDGTFFYSMTDIDVSRVGNSNFAQVYDSTNNNSYSETIRVNSGVDSDSEIYIPGDIAGNTTKQYKYTNVSNDGTGVVFSGKTSDSDPGTIYSGFVTIADNNQGIGITYWSSGAYGAGVNTFVLSESKFHVINSSTGTGGTIKTTKHGNANGNLDDGYPIIESTQIGVADGKSVVYTIEPKTGYWLDSIKVDGTSLTLPTTVGATTTMTLDGPSGSQRTGTLKNIGGGKYTFTFPDNNYDHKIHVDWDADYYFIKKWIPEEGTNISLTAKPYTFDGTNFIPSSLVNPVNFTVNRTETLEVNSSTQEWVIKKTDLPIEMTSTHTTNHDNPIYWFLTENSASGFTLLEYDNSNVTSTGFYKDAHTNANWLNAVHNKTDGAYMSIVREGGKIVNVLYKELSIEKQVTGNMGDTDKEFDYTITIYDGDTPISDNLTIEKNGRQITIANGGTIQLKHGDLAIVKNLIKGYKYTIVETDTDYIESYKIEETGAGTVITATTSENTITKQTLNEDQTVTFINYKENPVLTGVFSDNKPFSVLFTTGLSGTLVMMLLIKKQSVEVNNRRRIIKSKGKHRK